MNKLKLAVITGSRADYGLLRNTIKKAQLHKKINLSLIVTGTHLSRKFGYSFRDIKKDKFKIHHKIYLNINQNSDIGISNQVASGIKLFSELFKKKKFDLILLLGDRYEILSSAIASMIMKIPVAHIHGGEITRGTMDEKIRHMISKISSIHFTATSLAKKRLHQMGENPNNVYNVGAPGIENFKNTNLPNKIELYKKIKIPINSSFVLFCYHPNTLEGSKKNLKEIKIICDAIKNCINKYCIITSPNSDANSNLIINFLKKFSKSQKKFKFIKNLGTNYYFATLKKCDFIIGNSSSGIIEAPYLKKQVLNLGDRQQGREMSNLITNMVIDKDKICFALKKIKKIKNYKNITIYYKYKKTSDIIIKTILKKKINIKKIFYDF